MQVPFEVMLERDQLQQVIIIRTNVAVIGRGQDCDIRIDDPLASRHHCRFEIVGDQLFVVDVDSRNGSWVSGERVSRQTFLTGDVLRIGSTTLQLHGGIDQRLDSVESTQTQQLSREQQSLNTLMVTVRNMQFESRVPQLSALVVDAAISLCRAERGFLFLLDKNKVSSSLARNFAHEIVASPEEKFSQTLIERAISYPAWEKRLKVRLLIEKLIEKELKEQITIEPTDVLAYYRQHYMATPGLEDPLGGRNELMIKQLRRQKAEHAYRDWVQNLRSKYVIEINRAVWEKIAGL